jgi:hypothetical protein
MSAPTQLELAYRNTKAARLRAALEDGVWHYGSELDKKVGWRFGAAVHLVRNGWDGGPAWIVLRERCSEDGSVWRYRFAGLELHPKPKEREGWKARALRAERKLREIGVTP